MIRSRRLLPLVVISVMLILGVAIDFRDRPLPQSYETLDVSSTRSTGIWFCPGGISTDGLADFTIELVSTSDVAHNAIITPLPDPSVSVDPAAVSTDVTILPGQRIVTSPADGVSSAQWVGAMIEIDTTEVVVQQVIADRRGGVGRSNCLTRTSTRWIVPHGATRQEAEGEQLVLMLLNPYQDFAVIEVEMITNYGQDSVEGLIVPAGRVLAVDVANEVPAASEVTLYVSAVSGRVAASWVSFADGPGAGSGVHVAVATPRSALLWYIPLAGRGSQRRDTVAITNPSTDEAALLDIEIIADDPGVIIDPIELTIGPEHTELVNLKDRSRLSELDSFTVIVRSLVDVPVAVSMVSVVDSVASTEVGTPQQDPQIPGTAAMVAADAAAKRWLLPVEVPVFIQSDDSNHDISELHEDTSSVVIVNPSEVGIALVDLIVDGKKVLDSLELGPKRRSQFPLALFGSGHFVVEVVASSPVIAASELVGFTSRTASLGVAVSEPVSLTVLP